MKLHPTELKLKSANELTIGWNDGVEHSITVQTLREECPCASCRERRKAKSQEPDLLPVLRPEEAQPLHIVSVRPVGNYAYSIGFSDEHDTGIFTLEFLRQLGDSRDADQTLT